MKKVLFSAGLMGIVAASQAVLIASWTFEGTTTPADLLDASSYGGWQPETGIGTGSGFHASALTDWTTPSGNGSANSISSNTWTVGDYYQFQVSTLGLEDVTLSWDQTSSNTGPRDFDLQYSTDGTNFTSFAAYTVLPNASPNPTWNSTTYNAIYTFNANMSLVTALDNQANIYIRMTQLTTVSANGGVVAAAGTDRVDNVNISATAVPEPATMAVLGLGAAALLRRRSRK